MRSLKETVDDNFAEFAVDGLKAHNEYRERHGAPLLTLNKEMCLYAQEWADTCAKKGGISSRTNEEYGENLYSATVNKQAATRDAVKAWYEEIRKHNWGTENVKKKSFAFTQLIWKSTTNLGLGMATNAKGKIFIVAVYYPKGNISGEFVANVPGVTEQHISSQF